MSLDCVGAKAKELTIGCGLYNVGNSCFFNSTFQALFHIPKIVNCLQLEVNKMIGKKCAVQDKCITCGVLKFFKDTKSTQLPYLPIQFYNLLRNINKRFCKILNGKQLDAHEWLLMLVEETEAHKHSLSWFENNFVVDVRTVIQCSTCKSIYKSDGNVVDISVNIHEQESVQSALDVYFNWESVDDYHCVCCKKYLLAKKQYSLMSAPPCLCITMKQFSKYGKVNHSIQITPELTITKYFADETVESPVHELKYKLVAVVNHIGQTPKSGHYTATVCTKNNESYEFDDKNVRQINENAVKGNEAYILFYERIEGICKDRAVQTQKEFLYTEHEVNRSTDCNGFSILNDDVDLAEWTPIEIEIVSDDTDLSQEKEDNEVSMPTYHYSEKWTEVEIDDDDVGNIIEKYTDITPNEQENEIKIDNDCETETENNLQNVLEKQLDQLSERNETENIDDSETDTDTENNFPNVSEEQLDQLSERNETENIDDSETHTDTENNFPNVSEEQLDKITNRNETENDADSETDTDTENIFQNVSEEHLDESSKRNETEIETESTCQNVSGEHVSNLSGRRIVDYHYLFKQMENISSNTCKSCRKGNMAFESEIKRALISVFKFRCTSCGNLKRVESCPVKNTTKANINEGAVSGIVSIGLGHYHLQEFLAHLDIQGMSYSTYHKIDRKLQSNAWKLAKKLEEEALLEEIRLAKETGQVDSAGNALIAVEFDGSWGKRSYGRNFSSLSGCAAIIGLRTGKIVYSDVKNKYCHTCKIAQSKNTPPNKHECNKNYDGPSSGMETAIVVEGFIFCERKGARFNRYIGDGDSSTYKALRDLRLYQNPDLDIEKFECVNHLFRNFYKKFGELLTCTKFNLKGRKLLSSSLGSDIGKGVRKAAEYWRKSDIDLVEKFNNLERDVLNAPLHYLGVHDNCRPYFCAKTTNPSIKTTISVLKDTGVYYEILDLCQYYFANNAKSLIANLSTNKTEGFNSIIAKTLGGKRVCNSLAGSYKSRTAISDVQYNTEGHAGSKYHEFVFGEVSQSCLNFENKRKRKLKKNAIAKASKPKKIRVSKPTKNTNKRKLYGDGHEDVDFTPSAYGLAKTRFLERLRENQINRDAVEVDTRGQRHILKWIVVRKNLLTPSYFGRILNVNNRNSYTNIVAEILYKNEKFSNTAETRHQKIFELEALEIFCGLYGSGSISSSGIFIDTEFAFLGSSPFRLYGEDSIICVKCPKGAFRKSMKEAIDKNLIPFWKGPFSDRHINLKSHWYLEIQGQLRIVRRRLAHLVIYLGEGVYEIIEIERNDEFWKSKMEKELYFFYNEAMLKEIVDSRDARGMHLRKYNAKTQTFE